MTIVTKVFIYNQAIIVRIAKYTEYTIKWLDLLQTTTETQSSSVGEYHLVNTICCQRIKGMEHFKLMVEQIGFNMHYPGLIDTALNAHQLFHDIQSTFHSLRSPRNSNSMNTLLGVIDSFLNHSHRFIDSQINTKQPTYHCDIS